MPDLLEQRGHAHLLEDGEPVIGAAPVGAEADADAEAPHLGKVKSRA